MNEENTNPYATPSSSVDTESTPNTSSPYYFTTSTLKLSLMSICTLGFYELYWFYKNWVMVKKRTGERITPFWRAVFAPLWAYSCFKRIKATAEHNQVPEALPIGLLAIIYFILHALWRLPDPFWLVAYFSFLAIVPANNVALSINRHLQPDFKNNDRFSGWNWVGLILGGLFFLLALVGTFLPEA